MAGIDEVLERLVADGDFRSALARDPAAALAGYELTRDDVELLASRLDDGDDAERTVEQRTSKSAMLALLASFAGPGGGGAVASGHEDQIDVLSWSWGETQGDDAVPDDFAVPDDAADELYNKSQGKVEYTWKVEEGVKAEVDPDALTHKVEPGESGPAAPSTDDQGIIVINGQEDDGTTAPTESVGLNYNKSYYGDVDVDPEALDPALADGGDESEEGAEVYLKLGDITGEAQDPAVATVDDRMDRGGVKAEVDPDALTHKVDPGDGAVGAVPPDDGLEGVTPPDDGVVGGIPPDDTVVGANPPDDDLGARTDVTAAMDADDVMEIEDV